MLNAMMQGEMVTEEVVKIQDRHGESIKMPLL